MKTKILSVFLLLALLLSIASSGDRVSPVFADRYTPTIVGWGMNGHLQTSVPAGLSGVTAFSGGGYHSLALKSDGTVVSWGCGGGFDLGQCNVPADLTGVTAISAGYYHSLALKSDGTVVAWGENTHGQSTIPAGLSDVIAISAGGYHNLAQKSDGTIVVWGSQAFVPAGLSGVTAISAGGGHNLALKSDGTVVAWGDNGFGQIDVPAGLSGVTAISAGWYHSMALKSDGTVVGWGHSMLGQPTPVPDGLNNVIAIAAGGGHALALKNDGTVVAWGDNSFQQSIVPAGLSDATAISAGFIHSLAFGLLNHAPVAQNQSVTTNQGSAVDITLAATDEDNDLLTYSIVAGPLHGTLSGAAPLVTYTPAANYVGRDSFTFNASDGELVGNVAMVSIIVFPDNAAPPQVVVPVPGPALDVDVVTVNDGAGGQTDPHLSGDWVSYTDNSAYGVRFQNLDQGSASDRLIPVPDGFFDSLSDISSNRIVFMRASSAGGLGIYLVQIDPSGNPGTAVEVSPLEGALRRRSVIGGDTIAYEDRGYDPSPSNPQPEIALSSVTNPTAPAYRLSNDTLPDQWPAVSPDGNAVVWVRCFSATVCDVWRAERTTGVWGAPEPVSVSEDSDSLPDTNGPVTVYGSTTSDGDVNIRWSVKDASGAYIEYMLALPGIQRNPNISGHLISFEGNAAAGSQFDIWLYDLATNRLYQLTNNSVSESLTDISTGPGGLVRVAWAQLNSGYPYHMDVYAMSFVVDTTPPVITPEIQGTLGQNGWYTSDVTLTWSVTDDQSGITPTTGCDPVSITSDQQSIEYTCSATSAGGTSSASVSLARDATAPTVTVTPDRSPDSGIWYNHSVNFTNTCTDETSGRDVFSYREVYSGPNTASYTFWNVCTDRAGNEGKTSFTISYDSTKPVTTVTGVAEGASYTLGSVPPAGCSSTDNLSGVATEATVALTGGDAQGLGDVTATCSGALDAAGNAADTAAVHYTVLSANHAPTAADDTYTASANTPLEISPAGVLSNDTDEDGDPLSATLVSGPAHGELNLNADGSFTYTPAANYAGTDRFTYKANDGAADSNIATVSITVGQANTAPTASPGGPYLGAINTAISFDGSGSSDADGDALTYAWTFGDGGTGTDAMPTHSYTAAGIYDVCLTVHDGTVDSDPACTIAVVYDPSAGFVTGGGWINSPAGAYLLDPSLAGKATFGFVSKYQKGASVPTGTTQFQFDVAGLSFYSETYEWLLVNKAGTNAQFKGSGFINGAADPNGQAYKFMLWAGDGATTGGSDTFHIRIWWEGADAVENDVYDNGFDQAIGGGSIVVHTRK